MGTGLNACVDQTLHVTTEADGSSRVSWGESDWLGPLTPPAADGVEASVRQVADHLVVLRLEATTALTGLASGEFHTPTVAWTLEPSRRTPGGIAEGATAIGFQWSEFAYPTQTDADMVRWPLFPNRPDVVFPLLVNAPDGRSLLLAPLDHFHEQVLSVAAAADGFLRWGWHGDLDAVPLGFATELAIWAAPAGARDAFDAWGAELQLEDLDGISSCSAICMPITQLRAACPSGCPSVRSSAVRERGQDLAESELCL